MKIYRNNQLNEVIYQLRFSPILRINNEADELLIKFQEIVKEKFPLYSVSIEGANYRGIGLPFNLAGNNPALTTKNHCFLTEDKKTKINLTSSFIALSTENYENFNQFKDLFLYVIDIFKGIYEIDTYIRLGIRYINAFSKDELGISKDDNWSNYLDESLVGLYKIYNDVDFYNCNIEIPYEDNTKMKIQAGLGNKLVTEEKVVPVFILDKDVYLSINIKNEEISDKLDILHKNNTEMFEKLIKDGLRNKMEVIEDE